MPIPWLLALRSIPWGTIVANAPAIVRSAETLLSKTSAPQHEEAGGTGRQELVDRLQALEQRDRETAALLTEITAQVTALTTATEVIEARLRWLLVLAGVSLALSLVGGGLAIFAR